MRTKTLLLAAALSAAGLATSMAQSNVYSLNVVGYYNVPLNNNGFNLIANQFNASGGGALTINGVLGSTASPLNWNANCSVIVVNPNGTYSTATYNGLASTWQEPAGVVPAVSPGNGFFLRVRPSTGGASGPTNVTFVGEVPQGSLSTAIPAGYKMLSMHVPQAGGITTVGLLNPASLAGGALPSTSYQWNSTAQNYGVAPNLIRTVSQITKTWGPANANEPVLTVGESTVLFNGASATNWVRNFTVAQ